MGKVNQIIILNVLLIITLKNYWNELPSSCTCMQLLLQNHVMLQRNEWNVKTYCKLTTNLAKILLCEGLGFWECWNAFSIRMPSILHLFYRKANPWNSDPSSWKSYKSLCCVSYVLEIHDDQEIGTCCTAPTFSVHHTTTVHNLC